MLISISPFIPAPNTILSQFIPVHSLHLHLKLLSFLRLNSTSLHVYVTFYLFTSWKTFKLLPPQSYCELTLLWTWDANISSRPRFQFSLYSEVEFLDLTVILFTFFRDPHIVFSMVATLLFCPPLDGDMNIVSKYSNICPQGTQPCRKLHRIMDNLRAWALERTTQVPIPTGYPGPSCYLNFLWFCVLSHRMEFYSSRLQGRKEG